MGSCRIDYVLGYVTVLLYATPATGVPAFDVNLDLPPAKRWAGVTRYYRDEIVSLIEAIVPPMQTQPGSPDDWINNVPFDSEYEEELRGIAAVVNHPSVDVHRLKWLQMLYEMDSPYKFGCSDVLWACPNGTVVFGRNLDTMPGEYPRATNLPGSVYEVTLHRGRRPLMKMTQMAGEVGMHTGMRFPSGGGLGWAFAQNTRKPNYWQENYDAATKGGEIFMLKARRIMETVPDFNGAVQLLYTTAFAAPQYFTLSGGGKYEGAVLTIDRLGQHLQTSPPLIRVGNTGNDWHLVQTNDDLLGFPRDGRREQAGAILAQYSQDVTHDTENMFQVMHSGSTFADFNSILNQGTVFTSVMIPRTGFFKTKLPTESVGSGATAYGGTSLMGMDGDDDNDYDDWMGGYSMVQVSPGEVTPRDDGKNAFLAKRKTETRGVRAVGKGAKMLPDDAVSLMQSSIKLDL